MMGLSRKDLAPVTSCASQRGARTISDTVPLKRSPLRSGSDILALTAGDGKWRSAHSGSIDGIVAAWRFPPVARTTLAWLMRREEDLCHGYGL